MNRSPITIPSYVATLAPFRVFFLLVLLILSPIFGEKEGGTEMDRRRMQGDSMPSAPSLGVSDYSSVSQDQHEKPLVVQPRVKDKSILASTLHTFPSHPSLPGHHHHQPPVTQPDRPMPKGNAGADPLLINRVRR